MKRTPNTAMVLLAIIVVILFGATSAFAQGTTPVIPVVNPEDVAINLSISWHLIIGVLCAAGGLVVGFAIGRGNSVRKILPMLLFALLLGGTANSAYAQLPAPLGPVVTATVPNTATAPPAVTKDTPPVKMYSQSDVDALNTRINDLQASQGISGGWVFLLLLVSTAVAGYFVRRTLERKSAANATLRGEQDGHLRRIRQLSDENAELTLNQKKRRGGRKGAMNATADNPFDLGGFGTKPVSRPASTDVSKKPGPAAIAIAFLLLAIPALANAQTVTAAYPNVVVRGNGPAPVRVIGTKLDKAARLELIDIDPAGTVTVLPGYTYDHFTVVSPTRITVNITANAITTPVTHLFRLIKADGTELVRSSGTKAVRVQDFQVADARNEFLKGLAANKASVTALTKRVDAVPTIIDTKVTAAAMAVSKGMDDGISQRFVTFREEQAATVADLRNQVEMMKAQLADLHANEQALAGANDSTQDALRRMGLVISNQAPVKTVKTSDGKKVRMPDPSVAAAVAEALKNMRALTTAITIK